MFTNLETYLSRFWLKEEFLKKIGKSSSGFLLELFSRVDALVDQDLVYYDHQMDMETCFEKYSFHEFKWHQTPNGDMEWVFMLNRQGYLVDLAVVFYLIKDEKYLKKWKEIVFDFILENEEEISHPEASWRVLDAGIRLMNWVKSLTYLPLSEFSEVERKQIQEAMTLNANYIRTHLQEKHLLSNWGVLAVSGVLSFVYFFDEQPELYLWAKETLLKQASLQFTKKGLHWEQSPLYHHQVVMCFAYLYQIACYMGYEDQHIWKEVLIEPIRVSYYLSNSTHMLLALNDSDTVDFSWVYSYYHLLGFESECPEYTMGVIYSGRAFDKKHKVNFDDWFYDEVGGLAVVKSSDIYFGLFCGLHGSSHGHASLGAINLEMDGVPFITHPGRYTYAECEKRVHFKSERMQNTVLVEGGQYPSIESSWGYHWVAKPISMQMKKEDELYYFEAQWSIPMKDNETSSRAYVSRKMILDTQAKLLLVIDEEESGHALAQNFIIPTKYSSKVYSRFWTNGEMVTEAIQYSKRYNSLDEGIQLNIRNKKGPIFTCIALEPYSMEKESIPRLDCPGEARGTKIKCKTKSGELTIYYSPEDIHNGLKYLKDSNGNIVYGRMVAEKNNQTIRFR